AGFSGFAFALKLRVAEFSEHFGFDHSVGFIVKTALKLFERFGRSDGPSGQKRQDESETQTNHASRGAHDRYLFFSRTFFKTMLRCCACQIWSGSLSWSSSRNFW